jgi:hypothetical protein
LAKYFIRSVPACRNAMNYKYKSMIKEILLSFSIIYGMFIAVCLILSLMYRNEKNRILRKIKTPVNFTAKEVKTVGSEESGWKNNFPSPLGWDKSSLFFSDDFVFVCPKSVFPLIFRMHLQPFIIAKDPVHLRNKLAYSRIYKPSKAIFKNSSDYEVIFSVKGNMGNIRMHLVFKNVMRESHKIFSRIEEWC